MYHIHTRHIKVMILHIYLIPHAEDSLNKTTKERRNKYVGFDIFPTTWVVDWVVWVSGREYPGTRGGRKVEMSSSQKIVMTYGTYVGPAQIVTGYTRSSIFHQNSEVILLGPRRKERVHQKMQQPHMLDLSLINLDIKMFHCFMFGK